MNVRACRAMLAALWLAAPAAAQGFADMGAPAEGFALPDPDRVLEFPADHGAHPEFRIEWWYRTATLTAADGTEMGAQWTLFRTALAPGEGAGWVGQAGVVLEDGFRAWIDDWQMLSRSGPGEDALDRLSLTATGPEFAYALALQAEGPLVAHGARGYSVKSEGGQASHYYSQPFYRVSGRVDLPGGPIQVTGSAWLDREWSSQPLAADQSGWDWFSLSFQDGEKLMGFVLRDGGDGFTSGTWIDADGTPHPLPPGALRAEALETHAVAGREVPVTWRLTLAERGLDVTLRALNPGAWMATSVPYWEGPVRIEGSHQGRGYLEMTGY